MASKPRLWVYLSLLFVLAGLLAFNSSVWATPEQSSLSQTVPSPTPGGGGPSQPQPTEPPRVGITVTPLPAATPTAVISGLSALVFTKRADRPQAWPGATVRFTLSLTNGSSAPLQQVALVDALPAGLDPGAIVSGPATWDGRTLRVQGAALAAGGQLVVIFDTVVRQDVPPGGVITNQATATAAGGLQATTSASVVMPPAELPRTGAGS